MSPNPSAVMYQPDGHGTSKAYRGNNRAITRSVYAMMYEPVDHEMSKACGRNIINRALNLSVHSVPNHYLVTS